MAIRRSLHPIKGRKDFVKIATGVPHTNKQWIKYEPWSNNVVKLQYDNHFMFVPSTGRLIYETINLRRDEWLKSAKQQFDWDEWLQLNKQREEQVNLEICSGFGQWFKDRVNEAVESDQKDVRWIACEIKFRRCMSILGRLNYDQRQLSNTDTLQQAKIDAISRVICGDALFVMDNFFPDSSCDNIYIRFPEPWSNNPNKRITSHRMAMLLAWKVKYGGQLIISTDDSAFRDWTLQTFFEVRELWQHEGTLVEHHERVESSDDNEARSSDIEDDDTDEGGFENMLKQRGCTFYHMNFRRI